MSLVKDCECMSLVKGHCECLVKGLCYMILVKGLYECMILVKGLCICMYDSYKGPHECMSLVNGMYEFMRIVLVFQPCTTKV